MVAVEAEEPVKAIGEGCEDGLCEVARGISGHERAVTRPGEGSGKDGERAGGSWVRPASDSGIDTKPIDTAEDGHLLKSLCDPCKMRSVAVTRGDVDRNEHGANRAPRGSVPACAAHRQPGEVGENWKYDRHERRPRAQRLRQGGAGRGNGDCETKGSQDAHGPFPLVLR